MSPNFCVITTTYKRPTTVLRSVESVIKQSCLKWQQIIVIDDPDSDYRELESLVQNQPQITLIKNSVNVGKNASVNTALALLVKQNFNGYILFLDDDDWLALDCLTAFTEAITTDPQNHWFVANRTDANFKVAFTKNKTGRFVISYLKDSLITHAFSGDATHCLYFPLIKNLRFPTLIKNAEEWLYFATVSAKYPSFIYSEFTGTYSEGYAASGLTDIYQAKLELKTNTRAIVEEVWLRKLVHPIVLLYTLSRIVRRFW